MKIMKKIFISSLLLLAISINSDQVNDPFEEFNRKTFEFNENLDEKILKPVAKIYSNFPPKVKSGVTNFFNNLEDVETSVNQALQGKPKKSINDLTRFLINSTIGLAGFIDVASKIGLERHEEDFGQTLGYWGVKNGPYVFVPFVGPSTLRDLIGYPASWYLSGNFAIDETDMKVVFTTLDVVETRERLLAAENLIVGDKYEFVKDVYMQSRNDLVLDGEVEDEFLIDFESELFEEDLPENQ